MLHNIRVASPCSADWNKMEGTERVRFCSACQLNVYNFSEMTEREIRQLIQSHVGRRLCGRLYRRKDGTILTRNCPVGLRSVVRRLSRVAGAILSFMAPSFAAAQSQEYAENSSSSAAVEVHVTDVLGVSIPGAEVTLIQSATGKLIQGKTEANGRLRLDENSAGNYIVRINTPGFQNFESQVKLIQGKTLSINTSLSVENMGAVVEIQSPHIEPAPMEIYNLPQPGTGLQLVLLNKQGAVVVNADVILTQKGSKEELRGKTDANGNAFFPSFSSGDYLVKVTSSGNRVYKKHIQLHSGDTLPIQVHLDDSE